MVIAMGHVDGSRYGCYKILIRVGGFEPTVVLVTSDREAVDVMCDRKTVDALGRGAGWLPSGWLSCGHT